MADPGAGEKLKVFISYSRRDSAAFADELMAGLEVAGFAPFLDRHDIAAGEDWEARLGGLIAQSDTVVFVISPEAIKSEQCTWEVDRTLELSKRLLPVIFKSVPDHDIPEKLRRLQFVSFDSGTGFARPLSQLAEALRVDLDWIREHTRLGDLARRWDARGRPESLLLRGDDLDAAKAWMAARKAAAPEITDAQRTFVRTSDEAETSRLGRERAQLRRSARLLWAVASLVLLWFGYVLWKDYDVARRELNVFTARATDALNDEQFDRAMRYALQVYPARGDLPWITPFSTELEGKLAGGALSTRLHRQLNGHSKPVKTAAFSGDGKLVVTASDDNTARIWDAESGREIAVLKGHTDNVLSAAFSGDGKRVATASRDSTARIWDAGGGTEIAVLKGHDGAIFSAAFSADDKRLVTMSDRTARIWDAESGNEIAVLKGHTDGMDSAAISGDGKLVVTASEDTTARIWDAKSGREIAVLKNHDSALNNATFSADDKRVVTASRDSIARIWDTKTGKEITVLKGHAGPVSSAVFSGDGKLVMTASYDLTARIWDAESGNAVLVLKGHTGSVFTAVFSGDGKRVVTASADSTARIWDVESGNEVARLLARLAPKRGKSGDIGDILGLPWEGKQIAVLKGHTDKLHSATFSADGKRVVTASDDSTARVWDAGGGTEMAVLKGHDDMLGAAFSADDKRVVTASKDKTARIWDADSGNEIAVLKGHTDSVNSAAFSGDGKRVVTSSEDKTARIWDAGGGAELAVLEGHTAKVHRAAFSADGKRVVTASSDKTARIWDAENGTEIGALKGHDREVRSAAFSADGKLVVTAAVFDNVRIWNAESRKEIAVMKGHLVSSAAFSADGKRVATASWDGKARIWDAESGKEIAVLKGHNIIVYTAAFSGDSKRVVTASMDHTARIWDVTWATLMRDDALREGVCAEKLIGAAQEFTDGEMEDPVLRGIDKNDPIARNPCLRRGPLSLDYWTRLPGQLWRSTLRLAR